MTTSAEARDVRALVFKYRSYTPIPFLAAMVAFASPTLGTLIFGALVAMTGEVVRFWGVAIAGSETRTTGAVGGTYLITNGPFAYVRNPLYVGNIMLYAGAAIMSHALYPWLIVATVAWFYFQYSLIVSKEEEYLSQRFGEDYRLYTGGVARFIPRLSPYKGTRVPDKVFSLSDGIRSEKRTLQAITIVTALLVLRYIL